MGPVFLALVLAAVVCGAFTGRLEGVTEASLDEARRAVEIAIGLVGIMAFWLGMVEVVRRAGLLDSLARGLRPVFRRLFPEVPDGHPAVAAISLNVAANLLGLANAATPFGIEAMRQLDRLNGRKGTATDAMALFLSINTAGLALLPLGVIAVRSQLGSRDPAAILVTTWLATSFSTVVAIAAAVSLSRLRFFRRTRPEVAGVAGTAPGPLAPAPDPAWRRGRALASIAAFGAACAGAAWTLARVAGDQGAFVAIRQAVSWAPLPLILLAGVLYGWSRGVAVYEALVEGAKEGFQVALRIIPYMVAVLVAAGMFRASGALDLLVRLLAPLTSAVGFPAEALPMALVRPLSGSGALAIMTDILRAHGPDSAIGYLASTLQGSFETTFYVVAVYGGAVAMRRTRHAIPACLLGDLGGVIAATLACRWLLG